MFRLLLGLSLLTLAAMAHGGEPLPERYGRVEIAPTKTFVYIGSVSMTFSPFVRQGAVYEADYTAGIFPYFFYNETGRISVEISDDTLRQLARGEPVEFTGRGVRSDGVVRRVEGRAVPTDAQSGNIKVRVFVTKRIQLIFNTTYRFEPPR